jgi:hypothetical protein
MDSRNKNRKHASGGATTLEMIRPLAPATLTGGAVVLHPADFTMAKPIVGGSGAAEYAIGVYGNSDAQHAVAGSNVIAMSNPNSAPIVAPVTGGNRGGRGMLTDMAVPALLLLANTKFKRSRGAKRMRKSVRRTAKKMRRMGKSRKGTRGKR